MLNVERERDNVRRQLLGRGITCDLIYDTPYLDIGQDIRLAHSEHGLDFDFVEGLENLAQVLRITLTTPLGSDIFNIQFGFDGLNALAEESDPILTRERVRVSIIRLLQREPRIRRIIDVQFDGEGETETIDSSAAGLRHLNVYVTCEAVSGDETTTNITRLLPNV